MKKRGLFWLRGRFLIGKGSRSIEARYGIAFRVRRRSSSMTSVISRVCPRFLRRLLFQLFFDDHFGRFGWQDSISEGMVGLFFLGNSLAADDFNMGTAFTTKGRNRQRSFLLTGAAFWTDKLDRAFLFLSEEDECQRIGMGQRFKQRWPEAAAFLHCRYP